MSVARVRLIVAAVLFFGWLCWLGYLAFTKTTPVIVSRSQVMAANRFVVADPGRDIGRHGLALLVAQQQVIAVLVKGQPGIGARRHHLDRCAHRFLRYDAIAQPELLCKPFEPSPHISVAIQIQSPSPVFPWGSSERLEKKILPL